MTNEADKPSVEGLMTLVSEHGQLRWSEGVSAGTYVDRLGERRARDEAADQYAAIEAYAARLASEAAPAAPAAPPATPLREVLSDEPAKFDGAYEQHLRDRMPPMDAAGQMLWHFQAGWQAYRRALLAASSDEDRKLIDRLKLEAQIHAQEARTANATIAEIYQLVTGATGEPGNWHGAQPVRAYIAEQRELMEQALEALTSAQDYVADYANDDGSHEDLGAVNRAIAALRSRLDGTKT